MRNLNEHNITEEVLSRLTGTPDKRLLEIMNSLIRHLHDFAREVKLTEPEWLEGIKFMTRVGQMCNDTRQEMILLSDTLGLSQLVVAQNHSRPKEATEQTVFGPFHVEGAPKHPAHGADITGPDEKGSPLLVDAKVVDGAGKPVPHAVVDVWQADAEGFYDVQDPNWSMEHARLRGVFESDDKGRFSFRTILPVSYPIPTDGPVGDMIRATARHAMRPAHVHFMVKQKGFDPLVTHIFVDHDEYLDTDCVFGVRSSCIGQYVRHEPGKAPDGSQMAVPYYTLDYTFVLHPDH